MLNSLNKHYKNCMVDGKENFKFDLGVKGLTGHKELCRKAEKPSFVGDSWGAENCFGGQGNGGTCAQHWHKLELQLI